MQIHTATAICTNSMESFELYLKEKANIFHLSYFLLGSDVL